MKIGIDARFYRRGTAGIGRYTRSLLAELGQLDQQNEYVVFLTPEDAKEFESPGKNFRSVVVAIGHFSLAEQSILPGVIDKEKLDLIHYTNFNHPVLSKTPFVVTIHDLIMTLYPVGRKQHDPLRRWAYNYAMKHAARKSRRVLVPSGASRDDVVRLLGASPEKVVVTYEAYDERYGWPMGAKIKQEITRQYGIKKPFLLFVSQWRPHKGIKPLLEAYRLLREQYHDEVELVIGGAMKEDFPEISQAVAQAKDEVGGVITPGFIPEEDLPALYAAAAVYVLPSLYEGFCLTHLEAMAAGAPVATSNTSCMPEVLGAGAVYFDPRDPHDIARILDELLNNETKRRQLTEKGKKQVEKYSWRKMAEATLRVYREAGREKLG